MKQADTPRPESLVNADERAVLALEVGPCNCPKKMKVVVTYVPDPTPKRPERTRRLELRFLPRCKHVMLADHNVSVEDWLRAMCQRDPAGMAERPIAPFPTSNPLAYLREYRVLLYARRRAAGFALFHPLDYHQLSGTDAGVNENGDIIHDRCPVTH